jgi:hypothetical protein
MFRGDMYQTTVQIELKQLPNLGSVCPERLIIASMDVNENGLELASMHNISITNYVAAPLTSGPLAKRK